MWLSTVPTGCMDAFSMQAYLHNSIAYQTSEPMCLCTINTEARARVCGGLLFNSLSKTRCQKELSFVLSSQKKKRLVSQRLEKIN